MLKTVEQIQAAQVALIKQTWTDLDELAVQVANNSVVFRDAKAKVEKVGQVLPKRLSYLIKKPEKLAEELEKINSRREQQYRIYLAVSDNSQLPSD